MADDHIVHMPDGPGLPVHRPNVDEILFRCYNEKLSVEEAVEECRTRGASDVRAEQVEAKYDELARIAALFIEAAPNLPQQPE